MQALDVNKLVQECAQETNTPESEYNNAELLFSPPPENVLCMAKCLAEKLEILDSDGTIIEEKVSEIIEDFPEDLQTAVVECNEKIKKVGSCGDVEEYRKCIQPAVEKVKKMYHP